jgi:hypothetical protein
MKETSISTDIDNLKMVLWFSSEEPSNKTNFKEGETNDSKKFWYTPVNPKFTEAFTFKKDDRTLIYSENGKIVNKPKTKSSEKEVEDKKEKVEDKKEKVEDKKEEVEDKKEEVEDKKERDSSRPPPMSELRNEAVKLGVDSNLIEEARDSFDPQKELMRLIKYAEVGAGAEVYYKKYADEMMNSINKIIESPGNKDALVNFLNLAEEIKNNSLYLKEHIKKLGNQNIVMTESQIKGMVDQQIAFVKQQYFEDYGEQLGGKENTIKKTRRSRKYKKTKKNKRTRRGKKTRRKK